MIQDSYKHKGLRRKMIENLRSMGIQSKAVLDAMESIPRHAFLDSAFAEIAYSNKAFPIGLGQTISHPYTVARQTELLNVKPGQKVLEIGTGCGYQAAVLCALGVKLYSIERHRQLHLNAKKMLTKMGMEPYLTYGDGFKGLAGFAPYDKIIVTCGAPTLPENLLEQLKVNGDLLIPINKKGMTDVQEMMSFTMCDNQEITVRNFGEFQFVPMLEKRV